MPRLVYGAAVWWPRCKLKGAKKALDKVQRIVLGGIAGCIRSTPLVACEVLLGLPTLNLWKWLSLRLVVYKVTALKEV